MEWGVFLLLQQRSKDPREMVRLRHQSREAGTGLTRASKNGGAAATDPFGARINTVGRPRGNFKKTAFTVSKVSCSQDALDGGVS